MGRPFFLSLAFVTIASALTPSAGASLTLVSPTSHEPPTPTTPPTELRARDKPYGLCGYIDSTSPWTCDVFSTCYWNTDISGVGCCSSGSCAQFATSCVPYNASSTLVATGSNPYVTTCRDSNTPYCATATFEGGFFEMECWTQQWFWTIFLTYAGGGADSVVEQRLTGSNGAVTVIGSSTIGTSTSMTTPSGTGTSSPISPSSRSSTPGSSSGSAAQASTSSSSPSSSNPNSQRTSTGVIVGATVGSIVGVLALATSIVLLLFRRRKKQKKRQQGEAVATAVAANEEKGAYVKPELDSQGLHPLTEKSSDGHDHSLQVSELPGHDRSVHISELPGRGLARELDG